MEMKQVKVILCIFLIAKSSFGLGISSTFYAISGSSCCSETSINLAKEEISDQTSIENNDDRESENKCCCDDGICKCVCCGHLFTAKTTSRFQMSYTHPLVRHEHIFENNYLYNGANYIWQPPQNINKTKQLI